MRRVFFILLATGSLFCADVTRYGTFTLANTTSATITESHEPSPTSATTTLLLKEDDILNRLIAAQSNDVAYTSLLNKKERRMLRAYTSAECALQELLTLSAQARTSNWHPVYIQVLDTLIECAKTL